jgi:DNA-binding transcriptional MerR regulator
LTRRRLNTAEAAEALGISVDAVRMRARRGTLEAERDANGRLYVWLDTDETVDDSGLVGELRAHNETLREQLASERQAHAEARRIIAGLVERIPPAIEAPPEARGDPEKVEQEPERAEPRSDAPSTQEGARRPWWRRVFGR